MVNSKNVFLALLMALFFKVGIIHAQTEIVSATVYNATVEQCDDDPEFTAFMFKLDLSNPYKHCIVAVSRDLLECFPKGTLVKITGTAYDGVYTVMDKMNRRWTNRIDILINEDMNIGLWENVIMKKLE